MRVNLSAFCLVCTMIVFATVGAPWEAGAATGAAPALYSLAPTRACLIAAHVRRLVSGDGSPVFPEVVRELDWSVSTEGDIFILFAKNPAHGAVLAQRVRQVSHAFGATDAEIRKWIFQRRNVVVYPNAFTAVTPARRATVERCLH